MTYWTFGKIQSAGSFFLEPQSPGLDLARTDLVGIWNWSWCTVGGVCVWEAWAGVDSGSV